MKKYFKITDKQRDFIFLNKIEIGELIRIPEDIEYMTSDNRIRRTPKLKSNQELKYPFYRIIKIENDIVALQNVDINEGIFVRLPDILMRPPVTGILLFLICFIPFVIYNLFKGVEQ